MSNKIELPKDPKEILALAKEKGIELTEDQLEAIAGGKDWDMYMEVECHNCGTKVKVNISESSQAVCPTCGQWVSADVFM